MGTARFLFLAALAFTSAAAQVYKSTLPDGRVVYGDKPAPEARKVEQMAPAPQPSEAERQAGEAQRQKDLEGAQQTAARLRARERERAAAEEEVRQAEAALEEARRAREAGRAPLPGEYLSTAGGGVRPTEAYQARQRILEQAVSAAETRLARARQALEALR